MTAGGGENHPGAGIHAFGKDNIRCDIAGKMPEFLITVIQMEGMAEQAMKMLEIDELGLDPADRNMLSLMIEKYGDKIPKSDTEIRSKKTA